MNICNMMDTKQCYVIVIRMCFHYIGILLWGIIKYEYCSQSSFGGVWSRVGGVLSGIRISGTSRYEIYYKTPIGIHILEVWGAMRHFL